MGKNEEVIAPSAVILLNKFGNLDEIKKISDAIPAPKKNAKKISLMNPVILLKIVNKALTLKPFMKNFIIFYYFLFINFCLELLIDCF